MGGAFTGPKPIRALRGQVSEFEDVRSVADSVQRRDAVLVVSAYPWELEFEVEAAEAEKPDLSEDDAPT